MSDNLLAYQDITDNSIYDGPGVYFFYDSDETLLYIGKSVNVRTRVQSHLAPSASQRASQRIQEEATVLRVLKTAGPVGARLRELYEIKEHKPILNKRSRKKKKVVVARTDKDADGYTTVHITRSDGIRTKSDYDNIVSVYRSAYQAKEHIRSVAKEYQICLKRIGLSSRPGPGSCFQYQLGKCDGACRKEIPPEVHNKRFDTAFVKYQVEKWPFSSAQAIKEQRKDRTDIFVVDNWCLTDAFIQINADRKPFFDAGGQDGYRSRFNYDIYKVLAHYLLDAEADVSN